MNVEGWYTWEFLRRRAATQILSPECNTWVPAGAQVQLWVAHGFKEKFCSSPWFLLTNSCKCSGVLYRSHSDCHLPPRFYDITPSLTPFP